jgi:hypothetical protein
VIRFFKENDIFRLSISVIIFLIVRILFFVFVSYESEQAVFWLSLGERLAEGNDLYSEIWTGMAPLSALFYAQVVSLFGKSQLALEIIGSFICLFQILYFNITLELRRTYNSKTQLVPFVCVFFAHLHPSFLLASPVLLGSCFLLPLLNNLFALSERSRDDTFVLIGVYASVAILFHGAFVFFVVLILVAYIFSGSAGPRGVILTLLGAISTISLVFLFFLMKDSLDEVFFQFVLYPVYASKVYYSDLFSLTVLALPALVFVVLSYLSAVSSRQFLNYQQTCQFLMMIWAACALAFLFLSVELSANTCFLFIPPGVYFIVNQILMFKKNRFAELYGWVFMLFFGGVGLLNSGALGEQRRLSNYAKAQNLTGVKNSNVLTLSRSFGGMKDNRVATKFFDWNLTQSFWLNLDSYEKILDLEQALWSDLPDAIFDPDQRVLEVFYKIPSLHSEFKQVRPDLWIRKSKL